MKTPLKLLLIVLTLTFPGSAEPADIGGKVERRAWLGVALNEQAGKGLGPVVTRVTPGGPMDRAGVRPGDSLIEIDGAAIADLDSLGRILRTVSLGKTVPIRVVRDGRFLSLAVMIQSRSDYYQKEAARGDPIAQTELAQMYLEGRAMKRDYGEAAKWFGRAAEQGNTLAQYNLGTMHTGGLGVRQDAGEAVRWFRKAADQGDALAQNSLGNSYKLGVGVAQNYAEAVRWYQKAAEQGRAEAQHNLALMYDEGLGVGQSPVEALKWYTKAADQNYTWSYNRLGTKYENGDGVPQDTARAAQYYKRAAEAGLALAQKNLARMYEAGKGVPQNYQLAAHWYRMATREDDEGARSALQNLYGRGLVARPPAAKILDLAAKATPEKLRIRDTVSLELTYSVWAGDEGRVIVQERRGLRFENQLLPNFPVETEAARNDGTYTTAFQQTIPPRAKPGFYLYEGEICLGGNCVTRQVSFEVLR